MSITSDSYESTKDVLQYSAIILNILIIPVQMTWVILLLVNVSQKAKIVSRLVRNGYQHENINVFSSHKNKLLLYKYLLMNVVFELLITVQNVPNKIFRSSPIRGIAHNIQVDWQFFAYLYAKYFSRLIEMVLLLCILEALNLTILFVKDVYLRNSTHSGMRKKINRFIMRFLLLLALGVSGIGLGIAYILCEVYLITQLVLYYRYSRQLYRSLGMHYEDTKYEFGDTSIEARTALKHKKHYKWWTIWLCIIAFCMVVLTTMLVITMPLQLLNEGFIEQRLIESNVAFIHSDIYYYIIIASELVFNGLGLIAVLTYLPIYVIFSMYYLCHKFLS